MKKILQRYLNLLVVMFCAFFLSGCGASPKPVATDMVILVGNHSNSAKIIPPIDEAVEKVYISFGNIAIIAVDGSPTIARGGEGNIIGFYDTELNWKSYEECEKNEEYWKLHTLIPRKNYIITNVNHISADSPEVDLIASLFEAVKAINAIKSDNNRVKEIIIIDTGLSTTGALSFLDKDLFALVEQDKKLNSEDVKQVILELDASASLPDLNGIAVTWYGLGAVCSPQTELTSLEIYNLRVIWGEILKAGNALKSPYLNADCEYGIFIETLAEGQIDCDYKVTPVTSVIEENANIDSDEKIEVIESSEPIVSFSNEKLPFIRNMAEYADNEFALSIIKPYAQKLLASPNTNILIVGTVSDPNRNGGDIELSQERAERVKCSFIEFGISESRITVCGIGSNKYLSDLYNAKEWQGDEYIDSEAAENRAVYIMPMESELAQKILSVIP